MNQEFQPELYKDEYQERLKALIEQKIAGKEITDDDLRAAIKVMNRSRAARRASSSWPASTVMSSPPSAAPPCCAPLGS